MFRSNCFETQYIMLTVLFVYCMSINTWLKTQLKCLMRFFDKLLIDICNGGTFSQRCKKKENGVTMYFTNNTGKNSYAGVHTHILNNSLFLRQCRFHLCFVTEKKCRMGHILNKQHYSNYTKQHSKNNVSLSLTIFFILVGIISKCVCVFIFLFFRRGRGELT